MALNEKAQARLDAWRSLRDKSIADAEAALRYKTPFLLEELEDTKEEPETAKVETAAAPETTTSYWDSGAWLIGESGVETAAPSASTTTIPTYTAGKSLTRSDIIAKIKLLRPDISDDLAEAMAILIGAESGYNSKAKNGSSSAYGYGLLIKSNLAAEMLALKSTLLSDNTRKALETKSNVKDDLGRILMTLDLAIDEASNKYRTLLDDDLLDLVLHHYYDKNKERLAGKTRDEAASYLALYGLAPGIATNGSATVGGVTYTDSDDDLYKYLIKYHPYLANTLKSWRDHMNARYKAAGYSVA